MTENNFNEQPQREPENENNGLEIQPDNEPLQEVDGDYVAPEGTKIETDNYFQEVNVRGDATIEGTVENVDSNTAQITDSTIGDVTAQTVILGEKREKQEGAGELPPIWNIDRFRNPNFTGRDVLFEQLTETLKIDKPVAITQTISGLGGVGKTQTVVEYAYRFAVDRNDYQLVWFINAESITLASQFAQLVDELELPERFETDIRIKVEGVKRWLGRNKDWLLIFDNAEDPTQVEEYLPQGGQGHILITSRDPNWRGIATSLELQVFEREESQDFLEKRTGIMDDRDNAGELAEELGDLPLALEQAGAFIEVHGLSYGQYKDLFQRRRQEIWEREKQQKRERKEGREYPDTVETTWSLSMERIERENPASIELMNISAYLAPDNIPKFLFEGEEGREYLPEILANAMEGEMDAIGVYGALRKYSMIENRPKNFSVHRLVQAVVRDSVSSEHEKEIIYGNVNLVHRVTSTFSETSPETWDNMELIVNHIQALVSTAVENKIFDLIVFGILINTDIYLRTVKSQYNEGVKLSRIGIEATKAYIENPIVKRHFLAALYSHLGNALSSIGSLNEAHEMLVKALQLDKESGDITMHTAYSWSNLAGIQFELGERNLGRESMEKSVKVLLELYDEDHITVAKARGNLAMQLIELDDYAAARSNLLIALSGYEKFYGGRNHPEVAHALGNLGTFHLAVGEYKEAKDMLLESLEIKRNYYDENNYEIIQTLLNLAAAQSKLKEYVQAKKTLEEVIVSQKSIFGSAHPGIAQTYNSIGIIYAEERNYEKAKGYYLQSLRMYSQFVQKDNPKVLGVLKNLAKTLNGIAQNQIKPSFNKKAITVLSYVLEHEEAIGAVKSDIALTLGDLALIVHDRGNSNKAKTSNDQGDYIRSAALFKKAIKLGKEAFEGNHPFIVTNLQNLGFLYDDMENYENALSTRLELLELHKDMYGEENSEYAITLLSISITYSRLENVDEAVKYNKAAIEILKKLPGDEAKLISLAEQNLTELENIRLNLDGLYTINPNSDLDNLLGKAATLIEKNLTIEAKTILFRLEGLMNQETIGMTKEKSDLYFLIGLAYIKERDRDNATIALLKAATIASYFLEELDPFRRLIESHLDFVYQDDE